MEKAILTSCNELDFISARYKLLTTAGSTQPALLRIPTTHGPYSRRQKKQAYSHFGFVGHMLLDLTWGRRGKRHPDMRVAASQAGYISKVYSAMAVHVCTVSSTGRSSWVACVFLLACGHHAHHHAHHTDQDHPGIFRLERVLSSLFPVLRLTTDWVEKNLAPGNIQE